MCVCAVEGPAGYGDACLSLKGILKLMFKKNDRTTRAPLKLQDTVA